MFDLKAYIAEKGGLVDSYLKSYFGFEVAPALLKESMAYSLFAGGKRIRPVLALASYEACGKDPAKIVPYASALELIHTYSLIHDDLPAMDDDDLRRGKPTNHKVYGEAMAILAGDGLLTEAFRMLAAPQDGTTPSALLGVINDVAEKAGLWGMVAGQVQDMLSENPAAAPPMAGDLRDEVTFIHIHKTARLITASVRMGGLLACADAAGLSLLTGYGESIGVAFQIVDDILDLKGETAHLGKTAGSDLRKGKLTYPAVFGLEESSRMAEGLVEKAVGALGSFGAQARPLRAIARYIFERTK